MRALRLRIAERPNYKITEPPADPRVEQELVQLMLGGNDPIAEALDPLNGPEICCHWAEVTDKDKKNNGGQPQYFAEQNPTHRESFQKLVRVTRWLEEDLSHMLMNAKQNHLTLQLFLPVIVIATPDLHIYDATKDQLEKAQELILDQTHEAHGSIHRRYVDVVTEAALPELVARYQRSLNFLAKRCSENAQALLRLAHEQSRDGRDEAEAKAFQRANARINQSAGRGRRGTI